MEKYIVNIINLVTKKKQEVEIIEDEEDEDFVLKVLIDSNEFTASDYGYFQAYQKLRDKVLKAGYGIQCKGSCLNAVQSGMMSACSKVYIVKTGKQVLMKDIVDIYDYIDINEFPSTKEQNDFFEKWTESL